MSETDFLDESEPILYTWNVRPERKGISKNVLSITKRRLIHFNKYKREWRYRDIPLKKIFAIENGWHGKSIILLIGGAIGLIIGIIFLLMSMFMTYQILFFIPILSTFLFFVSIILIIGSAIAIYKGSKEYGYLMINNYPFWRIEFHRSLDISKIRKLVKIIYSLKENEQ